MGKTKTAFLTGIEEPKKSSVEELVEKRKRQKELAEKNKPLKEGEKIHLSGLKGGQRIVAISTEPLPESKAEEVTEEKAGKKPKKQKVRGRKYQKAKKQIDTEKYYSPPEAIKL